VVRPIDKNDLRENGQTPRTDRDVVSHEAPARLPNLAYASEVWYGAWINAPVTGWGRTSRSTTTSNMPGKSLPGMFAFLRLPTGVGGAVAVGRR
jgi:hypothetical protein